MFGLEHILFYAVYAITACTVAIATWEHARWRKRWKAEETVARLTREWRESLDAAKVEWDKEFNRKYPLPLPEVPTAIPSTAYPPTWCSGGASWAFPSAVATGASYPSQVQQGKYVQFDGGGWRWMPDALQQPIPPDMLAAMQYFDSNSALLQQWIQQLGSLKPPTLKGGL